MKNTGTGFVHSFIVFETFLSCIFAAYWSSPLTTGFKKWLMPSNLTACGTLAVLPPRRFLSFWLPTNERAIFLRKSLCECLEPGFTCWWNQKLATKTRFSSCEKYSTTIFLIWSHKSAPPIPLLYMWIMYAWSMVNFSFFFTHLLTFWSGVTP